MTRWSHCRHCGRPLRSETARTLGYGRDCARKRGLPPPKRRSARPVPRPKPVSLPPAPDTIPGQDAIPMFFHQPTLDSL